ncbi:MAG: Asp-tRNA(Asn)/Glu-tRNA(Gln) amidotransferase subunit GatA [Candidatus Aenigmarchaeota archaeon]|nr:Asp-tRNA(Asn)/Glu-tRNA(Gln) amidotransferase subunit GatA [Candidatus Aenigmarchaeota archaeon]
MTKYTMSVKEFLEESRKGNINFLDFAAALLEETQKLNKKFQLLREICDIRDRLYLNPPLNGLPISVKDCICVKGVQSYAGSKILEGYIPTFDATCVDRLKDNGVTILGKTNQDEFGFGTFSTNSGFEVPKNPLDPLRSCGGSSGGAAGLVAALDYPHVALAQSTGGSISAPAAFCGVVGITPTYGLVSRYGLIDYANSLDKIGVIGKSVHDVALILSIISGKDEKDQTSIGEKKDYSKDLSSTKDLKGVKIAVPKEYFQNLEEEVEKEVWNAIKKMESNGATYEKVSLKNTKYGVAAYYIIATAEASTNLAKYCGMRYGMHGKLEGNFNEYFSTVRTSGLTEEAKRRIILGTFTRMAGYRDAYYLKAMKIRTLIIEEHKNIFKKFDVIASPSMPIQPPKFKEIKKLTPVENYQMDFLTIPANLAGMPHLSVPVAKKTPIGLHLTADHLSEDKLFKIGSVFEKVR